MMKTVAVSGAVCEVVEYPELHQVAFYGDGDGEWIAADYDDTVVDLPAAN